MGDRSVQKKAITLQISFGGKANADSCEKEGNPKPYAEYFQLCGNLEERKRWGIPKIGCWGLDG